MSEFMNNFTEADKKYYGEITFNTLDHGIHTVLKVTGEQFQGNQGQKNLVIDLQSNIRNMGHIKQCNDQIEKLQQQKLEADVFLSELPETLRRRINGINATNPNEDVKIVEEKI